MFLVRIYSKTNHMDRLFFPGDRHLDPGNQSNGARFTGIPGFPDPRSGVVIRERQDTNTLSLRPFNQFGWRVVPSEYQEWV